MAKSASYSKQVNGHTIRWSSRQKRWVVKKGKKQVCDSDTESSAISWVKRNT
mgnify:CR=1 FL=1